MTDLELPTLDGNLRHFKFFITREDWLNRTGAWGRPLSVAVIGVNDTRIHGDDPKAYAYDNAKSIRKAAERAKAQALRNIAYSRQQNARYGKWEGSYPPKKLSEVDS